MDPEFFGRAFLATTSPELNDDDYVEMPDLTDDSDWDYDSDEDTVYRRSSTTPLARAVDYATDSSSSSTTYDYGSDQDYFECEDTPDHRTYMAQTASGAPNVWENSSGLSIDNSMSSSISTASVEWIPRYIYVDPKFMLTDNSQTSFSARSAPDYVVDSGCSTHMVPSSHVLFNESPIGSTVRFGVASARACSVGDSSVFTSFGEELCCKGLTEEGRQCIVKING